MAHVSFSKIQYTTGGRNSGAHVHGIVYCCLILANFEKNLRPSRSRQRFRQNRAGVLYQLLHPEQMLARVQLLGGQRHLQVIRDRLNRAEGLTQIVRQITNRMVNNSSMRVML